MRLSTRDLIAANLVGRPIGSVFIDRTIHRLIVERLSKVRDDLEHTPEHVAWKMLSGRFQRLKCAFGTDVARTPMLSLEVPFLKNSRTDLPVAGIYEGQMNIEWYLLLPREIEMAHLLILYQGTHSAFL